MTAKMEVGGQEPSYGHQLLHIVERCCAPEPINVHYVMIFFDICIPHPGKKHIFGSTKSKCNE